MSTFAAYFVLAATLVIFAFQLRSLYTVPVFDSVRWGGDETWLMREFGNQIEHGVMSYPENFGGPTRTDGVLAGSMWGDALIYGLPGAVFFPSHDYVSVGRTVTAFLALLLIASIYFILRKLKVSPLLSALTVLLVVACQGFVWASHSARYDLLTGLALIWYCYFLSRQRHPSPKRMIVIGLLGSVTICASRHMLLLGLATSMVFLFEQRIWKEPMRLWSWFAGSAVGAAILSIAYLTGAHEFSLFGHGGSEGSYSFVLNQIPILRPFSRNVQISNLTERLHLFALDAPGILLLLCVAILAGVAYILSTKRKIGRLTHTEHHPRTFWISATILCTITWVLTEGSRPYYLFHIAPLLAIAIAVAFAEFQMKRGGMALVILVFTLAIVLDLRKAIPDNVLGSRIARDQASAITKFLKESPIPDMRKPRILLDVAGLDRALTDTTCQVLTLDMFQPPHETDALIEKLISNQIDYVILRSCPVGSPFEPGRALLPHVLDSIGSVHDFALGVFYDDGRNYDEPMSDLLRQGVDTLRLYRVLNKLP